MHQVPGARLQRFFPGLQAPGLAHMALIPKSWSPSRWIPSPPSSSEPLWPASPPLLSTDPVEDWWLHLGLGAPWIPWPSKCACAQFMLSISILRRSAGSCCSSHASRRWSFGHVDPSTAAVCAHWQYSGSWAYTSWYYLLACMPNPSDMPHPWPSA